MEHPRVIPFSCPEPLAEPAELAELRETEGLARVRTSTGHPAWLATRYDDVRSLCADRRIGKSHPDPARAPRLWNAELFAPERREPEKELDERRRVRAVVMSTFGRQRIEGLRPSATETCEDLLSGLVARGTTADLVAEFAEPFATDLLFDYLGIPLTDREAVRAGIIAVRKPGGSSGMRAQMRSYFHDLMQEKSRNPGADALSEMISRLASPTDITLLSGFFPALAEYDTIANRIGYGLLALLAHPGQLAAVRRDGSLVPSAIEEIMRFAVPGGSWLPRYALVDFTFQGADIRRGDLIVCSAQSANRDSGVFADPDTFDAARTPNPHLGFGHGKFYCPGAPLSRMMLEIVIVAVFRRLPNLRLAVPPTELLVDTGKVTGGLVALPVSWDAN
ncbi:hypothetical protein DPM19_30185 [Actinomadura craniellae]|uniref:Cytochrome P450 n=1 Tax=Actinomadura craniellae TaxID=2231787 RepID=A0A365GXL8_9ACTN|nr:cytochrome P450 [Actinomadura craniellae]RAY11570.1 hypothetical protein DPM19_30185 [Actinomadura craniellae]